MLLMLLLLLLLLLQRALAVDLVLAVPAVSSRSIAIRPTSRMSWWGCW